MELVECVPNVSEGRRPEVILQLGRAIESVPGTRLLDVHSDADHHRSVFTFVGSAESVAEAAFELARAAVERIDLRGHRGVHPRMGALDVLPFVPLGETEMATCAGLAQAVGRRIADELGVPVYLYGEAAMRPERRLLANVRRGGYEGLREEVGVDPSRAPDFGPALLGPAGACAVGARNLLIAFNVHLHAEVGAAQEIARRVRESSGGLPSVQALGLAIRPGISQVSTNLMEPSVTPLHVVVERIRVEAERLGVTVGVSELVGLLPEEAVMDAAADALGLPSLRRGQVIELAAEQAFLASS